MVWLEFSFMSDYLLWYEPDRDVVDSVESDCVRHTVAPIAAVAV